MEQTNLESQPKPEETKTTYEVYAYDIPKVTPDGRKALPVPPFAQQNFPTLEAAKDFFRANSNKFERVHLLEFTVTGTKKHYKLLERYRDGQHELGDEILHR